jgi:ABC-type phosphate/phosphonate transport system substrate-binding protein
MKSYARLFLGAGAVLLACVLAQSQQAAAEAPDPVRIGLVQSLFRDVPAPLVQMLSYPFRSLMRAQTGMNGQLVTVPDWGVLGRQLHDKQVQLGVFHGIEFAWARQKYPDLRPLCIAINRDRNLYAFLVTRDDNPARQLSDLKGKALALPRGSREHCRLFLERLCAAAGQTPEQFFAKISHQANVEMGLDDVLRGKVQAAVVDSVSLHCYETVKPGCYGRLRVLQKSDCFPAAVIAYRQGALDQDTLDRFKTGMITANQNERGRELMTLWKLTAFEAIPEDFEQTLSAILKAYPAPTVGGPSRSRAAPAAAAP